MVTEAQADVLGRLLVLQHMLDALPDETRIAEFMRRALREVPGIADLLICLRGRLTPPDTEHQVLCSRCEHAWEAPESLDWAAIGMEPGVHYFPVQTLTHLFGLLIVRVADPALLEPYLDFLRNIANTVAVVLETRLYQAQLQAANAQLSQARDELEIRVADRTRELTRRNSALVTQIEERKRLAAALEQRERKLYELAYYDELTGLLTQRAFVEGLSTTLGAGIAVSDMVAVIAITIEQFGRLGDAIGYRGTEEVLKAVAGRLKDAMPGSHLLARARGERFYVGVAGLRSAEALEREVRAFIGALDTVFTVDGQKFTLRFRIGVAIYPADARDIDTLMLRAEAATHLAHDARARGGPVYYSVDLAERSRRRLTIDESLREAVSADQFSMVYQPRGSLVDGRVVGAESLLRWTHPVLGNVSPGEFIPIAEESGAIGQIGTWVMRRVCRQIDTWRSDGVPLVPISLNLTMYDVLSPTTIDTLVAEAHSAGVPLDLLEVEITESAAMVDVETTKGFLNRLRALGVRGIIDDFGTGYSSLAYLLDLPFSVLKIDKRFVDRIQEQRGRSLIDGIVTTSHLLDYSVVAEGVEHEYQAEFLRASGCDTLQGYLYSRPLSPADFPGFLVARQVCAVPPA